MLNRICDNHDAFVHYLHKVMEGYKEQYGEDSTKVSKINLVFAKLFGNNS